MFVATRTQTQSRTTTVSVPLPGRRLGTLRAESKNGQDTNSKSFQFGTPQQPNALIVTSNRGTGFFYVQTKVCAAPVLEGIVDGGHELDTYKAMEFGTATAGYFTSSVYAVTPGPLPTAPLRRSELQPIFFCTETAPYLTQFLTAVWDGVEADVETAKLVKEVAGLVGVVTGSLGATIVGAKTGTTVGACAGGVAGAISGAMLGGAMGYIHGKGVTRAKDHDLALARALGIFMTLSASDGEANDTNAATASLHRLMDAHQDKKGTPFETACQEVRQYIDMVELLARQR
jgi:hypothetical protein